MGTLLRLAKRGKIVCAGIAALSVLAFPAVARAVNFTDNGASVTFENGDGKFTIYKSCTATSDDVSGGPYGTHDAGVGPAYVAKYEARTSSGGYSLAVNGIDAGGTGEVNRGNRGGLGIFHWFHHRGGVPLDWNNTWNISNRRCAFDSGGFGVASWTTPVAFVDGNGLGHYDQDLFFTDGFSNPNKILWVRYRWLFRGTAGGAFSNRLTSDARLWVMVVQDCTNGVCGNTSNVAYMKAPKIANNINGTFSTTAPSHLSNFTSGGNFITYRPTFYSDCSGTCVTDTWNSVRACDAETSAISNTNTAHCGYDTRARTRFDYGGTTTQRGCNSTNQVCFNIVAMAYPVSGSGGSLDIVPGQTPSTFENGFASGFDAWAWNAGNRPSPGSGGCGFFTGTNLTNPQQNDARSWEYFDDSTVTAYTVLDKAWEECTTGPDSPSLFRQFGNWDEAYGVYLDYSLDAGWHTDGQ